MKNPPVSPKVPSKLIEWFRRRRAVVAAGLVLSACVVLAGNVGFPWAVNALLDDSTAEAGLEWKVRDIELHMQKMELVLGGVCINARGEPNSIGCAERVAIDFEWSFQFFLSWLPPWDSSRLPGRNSIQSIHISGLTGSAISSRTGLGNGWRRLLDLRGNERDLSPEEDEIIRVPLIEFRDVDFSWVHSEPVADSGPDVQIQTSTHVQLSKLVGTNLTTSSGTGARVSNVEFEAKVQSGSVYGQLGHIESESKSYYSLDARIVDLPAYIFSYIEYPTTGDKLTGDAIGRVGRFDGSNDCKIVIDNFTPSIATTKEAPGKSEANLALQANGPYEIALD